MEVQNKMVYDCFTFFNELDLLEIRLNILKDVVDKFVLVEATLTHQGKPKPLYYEENKARFAAFHDKIIHVVVDKYPDYEGKSSWVLERHQRDMIRDGLKGCKPDDVVIVSDLDEIPAPEKVIEYMNVPGVKIFRQKMFYYFINCINDTNEGTYRWNGSVMVNYSSMESPQALRNIAIEYLGITNNERAIVRLYCRMRFFFRNMFKWKKITLVNDGGWHFSYLGGIDMIVKKVEAFAHTEYNKEQFKNTESMEKAINNGEDIFGRNFKYKFVPVDNTFPAYLVESKEKYKTLIKE